MIKSDSLYASNCATLAQALSGFAAIDEAEADELAALFLETTRRAIERRLAITAKH